jgi:hypothetical protein
MTKWYIAKGIYYILPKRKKRVKYGEQSINETIEK